MTSSTPPTSALRTRWTCGGSVPLGLLSQRRTWSSVVEAVLPGATIRLVQASHPYTTGGLQVDVLVGSEWLEVGECGLAARPVLELSGLPGASGLALGVGLDRLVMLAKGVEDIRLLRSTNPLVAAQMRDLSPYRRVRLTPAVRRDVSVALPAGLDEEQVGDLVQLGAGDDAGLLSHVEVRSRTSCELLPPRARERLGILPGQENLLVRLVLQHDTRSLTDAEANVVRDRVYAALHAGTAPGYVA